MARRTATALPEAPRLTDKKTAILSLTDAFCDAYLNAEYKRLTRKLIERIGKETPSPLLRGRDDIWAAGIVHAIGSANYLFDKSFKPYVSAAELAGLFGVATGSAAQKATQLRDRYPIDFPHTDFATKKMREMSDNVGGMLAQSGLMFGGGNITFMNEMPNGAVQLDSFLMPSRSPRKGEFMDIDREAMGEFYDLMVESHDSPKLPAELEALIAADPDFYDTYLTLADEIEDDDEARAATLRETAFHRALSRIVDGKGDFPASLPWGHLENRHIIRALDRGAIELWEAGNTDAALDIFRKLLKSNPHDNIGARNSILAIRLGQTLAEHEAPFELENGYMDASKQMAWFEKESARFPDEFAEWRKQVGE